MNNFETLTVHTNTAQYPIYIGGGWDELPQAFAAAGLTGRKILVVADTNTSRLFGGAIMEILSGVSTEASLFAVPAGEVSKSMDAAGDIYRRCIDAGLDRTSVIAALGGGVVGDLAGFAAATYMRGVAFAQIPTTLLAQVDSSVGGKVAVNFDGLKNIVGAFYQPRFVYANIETLASLARTDFLSGLGEAVKHGLIYDEDYLDFILQSKESISLLDYAALAGVVHGSCKIKAEVVRKDEREQSLREILNFGHTFGHGIESASDFAIPHGHAVAVGCMAALAVSRDKGLITAADVNRARSLYEYFGLPVTVSGFSPEEIYGHMKRDKKSKNGVLTVVLLRRPGLAYSDNTLSEGDILRGLDSIII